MRIQDNRERDRERGLSEKTLEQSLDSWYCSNIEYSIILNTILNLQLGQLHYISLSQMFVQRILSENHIHPFLWKLLNFTFHCNVELLINLSCQKSTLKKLMSNRYSSEMVVKLFEYIVFKLRITGKRWILVIENLYHSIEHWLVLRMMWKKIGSRIWKNVLFLVSSFSDFEIISEHL